jgi:hypothetical protein
MSRWPRLVGCSCSRSARATCAAERSVSVRFPLTKRYSWELSTPDRALSCRQFRPESAMPWRSPASSPAPSFMGHSSSPRASAIRPAAHSVRLFLPCMNHTICGWCTPAAAASRRWLRPQRAIAPRSWASRSGIRLSPFVFAPIMLDQDTGGRGRRADFFWTFSQKGINNVTWQTPPDKNVPSGESGRGLGVRRSTGFARRSCCRFLVAAADNRV